jgi:hypothetical protein
MNHKSNGAGHHTFDPKALSDLHLGYIEMRWEVVAAVAWKGYLHRGRGALLFTSITDPPSKWDCIYLPLEVIEGDPLVQGQSKLVRYYDPTRQIVALFLTPPDWVNGYCGGPPPERVMPPECYKKMGDLPDSN